jgi:hypothetical protein
LTPYTNQKGEVRKDLRQNQRLLVPEGRKIPVEVAGLELNGIVTVIGLGGMFIRTRKPQHLGSTFHLRLVDVFMSLEADCTARSLSDRGMGVEFTGISPENEQKLKMLLAHLKS